MRPWTWLCLLCTCAGFATVHTVGFRQSAEREVEHALQAGPQLAFVSGIVWSEPEPLPFFSLKQTGTFLVKVTRLEVDGKLLDTEAQLQTTWAGPLPVYGDRVTVLGSLEGLEPPRNPGQFDFADHLRRSGVVARCAARFPQDCRIDAHGAGQPLVAIALRASRWMQTQLALDLEDSPELAALITSMVLGLRGDTPPEVKDIFRTTGTMHLFAVSGLNIAMLAIIASYLLKPLGFGRRFVAFSTIPILLFYALVTGLSASCVRAAIMGSLVLLALLADRPGLVYNHLAAAAVLILAWDTNQLFVPGFQFSFVLVFVIVAFADRISRRLEPLGRPDPFLPQPLWSWSQRSIAFASRALAASFGVTLAAWVGSLLFTAGYFHLFSPAAILANLIAVPIAFCVLTVGVATVISALVSKPLAILFSNANWLCAKALLWTVKGFAFLPAGHLYVELPHGKPRPTCEVTVLDVGDGAAIHLRAGTENWLIDGGSPWRYASITLPYLRSRGVNQLDALLLSHGDAQHVGSVLASLDDLSPRMILDAPMKDRSATRRKFKESLAFRNRGEAFARRDDEFTVGPATVRVLFPPAGWQRANADDKTLVLLLDSEGRRILFMSDSGIVTERWLMDHEPALRADVIVKGHHAKDFSGTADFLNLVKPSAIVVGKAGYENTAVDFETWVRETEALGITIFRQDQCGAVSLKVRHGEITLAGFMTGQTFSNRAR